MPQIRLDDVTMIYPFMQVRGLFYRKQKQLVLEHQKKMPYTSNEGVIALQHFSAVINDGEFVAVLGPSGAGKSTLLRIIGGLENPPAGKVFFDGEDYTYVKPEDRDVAMVFQNYALYPNQTVYQNIAFPLEVKHTPREEIDAEVNRVAELLGLQTYLQRLPEDLSGGERQRVAIARAVIRKPSVLLLDEPFANLDVIIKKKLRQQLKKIHQAYKMTIVYVTHDQYDALSMAERIIVLKDGITQMDDTAVNVYNYPVNRFVGEFMGFPAMNIFEDVRVHKDNVFELLGQKFRLTSQQRKALKKPEIDCGIRAVNVHITDSGTEAEVDYIEEIEADNVIHLNVGDLKLTAVEKTEGELEPLYSPGQKVHITLDSDFVHIFDKDGNRI